MSLVQARGLVKDYRAGDVVVHAVRGVDFDIEAGAFAAFVGPSGSGKSTLLNMIGALDRPSAGTLTVAGTNVGELKRGAAADFRGEHIGFVFQDFNLVPVLSAFENIEYPLLMVRKRRADERRKRVLELLEIYAMERPDGSIPGFVMVYRATLADGELLTLKANDDVAAAGWFAPDEIPPDLAFTSTQALIARWQQGDL